MFQSSDSILADRCNQALGLIYHSVDAKEDLTAREAYQNNFKSELKRAGKIYSISNIRLGECHPEPRHEA